MRPAPPLARIYVTDSLRHVQSLPVGARTWWCTDHAAKPDELGVLYVKGQRKGGGISVLFRYVGPADRQESHCRMYRLATGSIEILARLEEPVSAAALKERPVLRGLPALRNGFHRNSFRLDEPYLKAMKRLFGWPGIVNEEIPCS